MVLWATNEGIDAYDLRFYSSEHENKPPQLMITWSNQPKTVYFLKDHLGSIRATVLDSAGAPVVAYDDYDPWGYLLAGRTKQRTWSDSQAIAKNKFTGKEWDDDYGVNWLHFPFRSYDPEIARWMVRDLLANRNPSFSSYHYVANNPTTRIDPLGLDDIYYDEEGNEIDRKKYSWWHNLWHGDKYYVRGSTKAPHEYGDDRYWEIETLAAEYLKKGKVSGVVEEIVPQMLEFVQNNVAEGNFPLNTSEVFQKSPGDQAWDFKKVLDNKIYIFGDKGYLKDYIGNVTWGMIMADSGWPLQASLWGAGYRQNVDQQATLRMWLTNFWNLGDDPRDSQAISVGYHLVPRPTLKFPRIYQ